MGEQKSIQTDRVVLVAGPDEEIAIVRWIYQAFVTEGKMESEIAAGLNAQGILDGLRSSLDPGHGAPGPDE